MTCIYKIIESCYCISKYTLDFVLWSTVGGGGGVEDWWGAKFLLSWRQRYRPVRRFASTGRGGVRRGGGRNILPSAPVAAKKTSDDGGGIGVSSQGEALEKADVGTVGERGGRPGPHSKPNKGWGTSGACMRRAPLGLVGCLGRDRGKTEGGAGGG